MSFSSLTDLEIDLGIDAAYKKFGCTLMGSNLRKVSDRLQSFRYEGLTFPEALRKALNFFELTQERRAWYKVALGAAFSSRAQPMHKGKTKLRTRTRPRGQYTVDNHGQYGFVLPNGKMETNHGRRTRKGE